MIAAKIVNFAQKTDFETGFETDSTYQKDLSSWNRSRKDNNSYLFLVNL